MCVCVYTFPGDNPRTFLLSAEEKDSRAKGGTDKLQTRDLSQFWINVTGVTSRCCCQANLDLWHNYFSKVWCRSGRSLITFPKSLTNPSFQQGKCSRVAITGSPSRLQPRIKGTRGDTMEAWVSQRELQFFEWPFRKRRRGGWIVAGAWPPLIPQLSDI